MNKLEELEKIIEYMKDIYDGVNPFTKEPLPKDSFINTVENIRIIDKVLHILSSKSVRNYYTLQDKISIKNIEKESFIKEYPISFSELAEGLREKYISCTDEIIEKNAIKEILINNGYIYINDNATPCTTEKGRYFGVFCKSNAMYFNPKGQELVIDLLCGKDIPFDEDELNEDFDIEDDFL